MIASAERLLRVLEERMHVAPSLRNMVAALPRELASNPTQADAVAALIVMNVWLFCPDAAVEVLAAADRATGGALHLAPVAVVVPIPAADGEHVGAARRSAGAVAARLGLSPMRRSKTMSAAAALAEDISREGAPGRIDVSPDVRERAVLLAAHYPPTRVEESELEELAAADERSWDRAPGGPCLRAKFRAVPAKGST